MLTEVFDNMLDWVDPSPRNIMVDGQSVVDRFGTVGGIAAIIVNLVIGVGFSVGLLAISYSFVMYVLSGGNPDKTKKAWNAFLYGVIGTAIAIGVFALKNIVVGAFGVSSTDIEGMPGF